MLRKLFSHAAIYGLSAQLPRFAGVLALPVITPYLTPGDYGVVGVVTAYVSVMTIMQSLGLSVVMVNTYHRNPLRYHWVWRQLLGFLTLWSVGYGLLMAAVLYVAVPEAALAHRLEIILLYSLPTMLFGCTELITLNYYLLAQRPLPLALRSFAVGITGVALNIYTIAYLRMGYMGWMYANFMALLVGFLLNGYGLYLRHNFWPIFNFKWRLIRQSLRVALPVLPHNISFFLLDTSDRLVLDVLKVPLPQIGLFNVASSFGLYFKAVSSALTTAASPFNFRLYAQTESREAALGVRRIVFSIQVIFLLATTLGCLWMKEIFAILIRNEELQQAYTLAIVMVMGYNFRPMFMATVDLLTYHEHTRKLWKISFVAGIGNVLLNLLLVPVFGYQAAAYTTFAALMYMGYAGFYLKEYKQKALVPYYPMLWLTATVLALVLVVYLATLALPVKALITAAVGGAAIAWLYLYRAGHTVSA